MPFCIFFFKYIHGTKKEFYYNFIVSACIISFSINNFFKEEYVFACLELFLGLSISLFAVISYNQYFLYKE